MSQAAAMIADGWRDSAEVDLDAECRRLTMRALGRSVLGMDLDERADALRRAAEVSSCRQYRRSWHCGRCARRGGSPPLRAAEHAPHARRCAGSPTDSCRIAAPTRPAMHRSFMR